MYRPKFNIAPKKKQIFPPKSTYYFPELIKH